MRLPMIVAALLLCAPAPGAAAPAPRLGDAVVVFYSPPAAGGAGFPVRVGDAFVGVLNAGGCLRTRLAAGRHVLVAGERPGVSRSLRLRAGTVHFFRGENRSSGFMGGLPRLVETTPTRVRPAPGSHPVCPAAKEPGA